MQFDIKQSTSDIKQSTMDSLARSKLKEKTKKQNQFIFIIENVLPEEQLKFLEDYFTKDKLKSALIHSDVPNNDQARVTDVAWLNAEDETTQKTYAYLHHAIKYANDQHFHWNLTFLETVQYGEYKVGAFYKQHTDNGLYSLTGVNRKLSFSILLNNDYEGGELELAVVEQEKSYTPVPNTAIFFPSSMPHCVKPVTKGVRKSLVGWCHGPNFV